MFFQPDSIDLHAHASAINPSHSLYFMLNASRNDALWEKSLSSKSSPWLSTSLKYNFGRILAFSNGTRVNTDYTGLFVWVDRVDWLINLINESTNPWKSVQICVRKFQRANLSNQTD